MPDNSRAGAEVKVRVWPAGASGIVLRLRRGKLIGMEPGDYPGEGVCDPACQDSLTGQNGIRMQRDLAQFLSRAFGLKSPLFRSPGVFRREMGKRMPRGLDKLAVLDIGCGDPVLAESASTEKGITATVDVWPGSDNASDGLEYRQLAEDGTLPFTDGEFDVVRGIFVLEHVADLSVFFYEVNRVLRPGGYISFVTTHCPTDRDPFYGLSLGHVRDFTSIGRPGPGWLLSLNEFQAMLRKAGFERISTEGSRIVYPAGVLEWRELVSDSPSDAEHLWLEGWKGNRQ